MSEHLAEKTARAEVGSYYTNGEDLVRITRTSVLGFLYFEDAVTGVEGGIGIRPFRRDWWLVRAAGETP